MGRKKDDVTREPDADDPAVRAGDVDPDLERMAEQLEQKADAIRGNLDGLVGELDDRRRRAKVPLVVGAVVAGAVLLGGLLWWRLGRRRPSRFHQLGLAWTRAVNHPDRVATKSPSVAERLLVSAAKSVVPVVARQLTRRLTAERP